MPISVNLTLLSNVYKKLLPLAIRASVSTSVFSKAVLFSIEDVLGYPTQDPDRIQKPLLKPSHVLAFISDSPVDSAQSSSHAMAAGMVTRRHLWLTDREVDASLCTGSSMTFVGTKPFGDVALEQVLAETKDKKLMPSQ